MKFQTTFIMERIKYFLSFYQREYKEGSAEYHFYFALAMALSLYELKNELELDEIIKTFISNTPYPKKKQDFFRKGLENVDRWIKLPQKIDRFIFHKSLKAENNMV